jgi:hypothetical protein
MQTKKPTKTKPINPDSAEEAFTLVKPELDAIDIADLVQINVDIPSACTVALGAADRLDKLGAEMAELPGFDRKAQKNLRRYALAALYANAVATHESSEDNVTTLLVEAAPLREGMLVAAEALAHRGIVSAQRVAEIRSGQGHLDTADDLIALSALFRDAWSAVQGKTAVTRQEVDRSAVLGSQLHIALGVRRVGTDVRSSPGQSPMFRERAFTLFVRAYDECRRAVTYLRWHENDLAEFAPSIYGRRKRRLGTEPETPTTDVPDSTTTAPSPIPDLSDSALD